MNEQNTNTLALVSGKIALPQRAVIYGPEGIGKSTLAAAFPAPVFLDTEGGTAQLDVVRFPRPEYWEHVADIITQLATREHDRRTLVIDTVDWLERLLAEYLCRRANKDSIEDFSYGKGYTILAEEFSRFLGSLEVLRRRGMHVVMVAHSTIRKFEQPDAAGAYDRYELKLSKQCAPLLKEWCDLLLFVNYFTKVTEGEGKKRAIGGKERRIYTTHCAAYDAKNRHGLADVIPMDFAALEAVFPATVKQNLIVTPAPAAFAPKPSAYAPATTPATSAPAIPVEPPRPCTPTQVENIQTLWAKLNYGQAELTKLFRWLEADDLEGVENWQTLTMDQAARTIGFLTKKLTEKETV